MTVTEATEAKMIPKGLLFCLRVVSRKSKRRALCTGVFHLWGRVFTTLDPISF